MRISDWSSDVCSSDLRSPSGGLSRDPRLLDLAGWQVGPLRFGLRLSRNAFTARSPDPYELDSPAEFVAENLEYFVLDTAYACLRPALHCFFLAQLGTTTPDPACDAVVPLTVHDSRHPT